MRLEKDKVKVVYFKTWWTNIGNAFIDIGGMYIAGNVFKEPILIISGGYDYKLRYGYQKSIYIKSLELLKEFILYKSLPTEKYFSSFSIIKLLKPDYVIVSGMVLEKNSIDAILNQIPRNCKLILLGAGGIYDRNHIKYISDIFHKHRPYVLVSRDEICYEIYSKYADYSFNGIDNAFFISDQVRPPKLDEKLVVFTFDFIQEPKELVEQYKGKTIIRPKHGYTFEEGYASCKLKGENIFMSDNPYDYVLIYANAEAVHSDRVHAVVCGLSYGVPCKPYVETERAKLFERVGVKNITCKLTKPDIHKLSRIKRREIKFLSEVLER